MFCRQCGAEVRQGSRFCAQCGAPVDASPVPSDRPPAEPDGATREAPALWNPGAASGWSVLFSPAFGSFLHASNWRALGEEKRARASENWFYASLAMGAVYILLGILLSERETLANGLARGLGVLYLIVWYFSSGRRQEHYVRQRYGSTYTRRPWKKPLLIAVGALAGYYVVVVMMAFLAGVLQFLNS